MGRFDCRGASDGAITCIVAGSKEDSFSPDSKHIAYVAGRSGKQSIVVDEEEKEYDAILRGSELVFDSPKLLHTVAIQDNEFFHVEVEIVEE